MQKYMQHNLVNPYIVALNTEMFRDSKALEDSKAMEDGYIQDTLNECTEHDASKAQKLRAAINHCRDTVVHENQK